MKISTLLILIAICSCGGAPQKFGTGVLHGPVPAPGPGGLRK